jgi:type II secretory pathway component PulF
MTAFAYKARMLTGGITEGIIEANDQRTAIEQLRGQKLIPLEINESTKSIREKITNSLALTVGLNGERAVNRSRIDFVDSLISSGISF